VDSSDDDVGVGGGGNDSDSKIDQFGTARLLDIDTGVSDADGGGARTAGPQVGMHTGGVLAYAHEGPPPAGSPRGPEAG
jgi:hypothetical protein